MDPDIWATLTDEERAGIADPGYSADDKTALAAVAGGDEGDDDNDPEGEDDPAPAAAPAAAAAAPAAETPAKGDESPEPAPAATAPEPVMPVYQAKLPEDFEARVESNKQAKDAAWSQFDSGELTREELQVQLGKIEAEGQELRDLALQAKISSDMTAQTAEQQWNRSIARNMAEFAKPEQGGIDYSKDDAKRNDLDLFVKALANDPKNDTKSMDWFLQEAHKRVRSLHGLAPAPTPSDTPAAANARRAPDLKSVPATLAQVPGGDGPGDVGGEFADIDNLDGDALENAINAMTPAQRERYAMGR